MYHVWDGEELPDSQQLTSLTNTEDGMMHTTSTWTVEGIHMTI